MTFRSDLSDADHQVLDRVWDELDAELRAEEEAAQKQAMAADGDQPSPSSERATATQSS